MSDSNPLRLRQLLIAGGLCGGIAAIGVFLTQPPTPTAVMIVFGAFGFGALAESGLAFAE